jgi:GTP-binding protein
MLDWFAPTGKPVHALLTKADKLSRNDGIQTLARVRKELKERGFNSTAQLFSSLNKSGVDEAETALARMFDSAKEKGPGKGDAPGLEQP